jgi:hypothetical protein
MVAGNLSCACPAMSSQEYAQLTESAASEPWSQLFRRDAVDVVAAVACLALTLLLEATVEPYHQFLQLTQLYDIAYPLKKNTVVSGMQPIAARSSAALRR